MAQLTSPRFALIGLVALLATTLPTSASAGLAASGSDTASRSAEPQGSWSAANRTALEQALTERVAHGLDGVAFLSDAPEGEQPAARDPRYRQAALAYAGALAHGRVDPATLHDIYTINRPDTDISAGLDDALAKGRLREWLSGLAPQDGEYARLSEAYRSYRRSAADGQSPEPIPSSGPIHVGDTDPRAASIAQQLSDDGYLSSPSAQPSSGQATYTQAIADAVTALQKDYGIAADGVVGPDTLEVLNLGPDDRARALAVALERRRWLPRSAPATRIDVNTAAARLRYYRDGKLVDERKVIVGEPGRETPMLASPIYRLVANPTWTIPKSIQNGEMAGVGASYLKAHNMVRRGGWIVQKSGPGNALGLVKFDMRDRYAIYLHDTSSRGLFDRSQRHLSHGCVRVSDALGFADMLAQQEGVDAAWQKARTSGKQQFVPLPREIPVRLLYHNVFVDDGGRIVFRTDPYGWNEPVAKALGFTDAPTKRANAQAVDVGP